MLTLIQSFLEAGEQKINDIQVRFNKLPDILNRYDTAQSELELSDDTDHKVIGKILKINIINLSQSLMYFYIL